MDVEELIARHPRVFHTMSAIAWPSVQRHGLLSTQQLIDLFGLDAGERERLLSAPRKQSTVLRALGLPPAVIRDQKPMKFVAEKIDPRSSLTEYLAAINSRVFFWASAERLDRLRQAKEYRTEDQVVLHVDTRALVKRIRPTNRALPAQLRGGNAEEPPPTRTPVLAADRRLPLRRVPPPIWPRWRLGRGHRFGRRP
ncbi:hypothetical protein OG990_16505 [Micromonospora sp. NBC_00858]|nr:hypothetical protein OG990_16505 [Micromonospora sp. NBC_00858]